MFPVRPADGRRDPLAEGFRVTEAFSLEGAVESTEDRADEFAVRFDGGHDGTPFAGWPASRSMIQSRTAAARMVPPLRGSEATKRHLNA